MRNGIAKKVASNPDQLAQFLGWFSIGLGLAELAAPRALSRLIGIKSSPGLLRLYGLREVASGIGILSGQRTDRWLQARVAGDALDLATLGSAMRASESSRGKVALATAAVAGVTALDALCATQMSKRPFAKGEPVFVSKTLTINRSPQEVYRFWRNFEQFPRFMNHLESVRETGPGRWHRVAKGPAGMKVEWDAEISEDKPNERIAWRSLEGADVDNAGEVRFEPATGKRGTVIRVQMRYNPPAGKLGAVVAKLLGEAPEKQITVDLLRFKQLIETGEVARTEGQPAGRSQSTSRKYDDFVRA